MRLELDIQFLTDSGLSLSAEDLGLGLSLGIISPTTVITIARQLGQEAHLDPVLRQLAGLDGSAVAEIREILGAVEPEEVTLEPPSSVRKWLYLDLLATYELRGQLRDPFEFVERIYADFGYPTSVEPFVRYMPVAEGAPSGLKAMIGSWDQYLVNEAKALTESSSDPGSRDGQRRAQQDAE